jgi:hypothetical protein
MVNEQINNNNNNNNADNNAGNNNAAEKYVDEYDENGEKIFKGLHKWNPRRIGLTNTLAIFAPRGSGKSFCIRDLLFKNQDRFKAVVVICPTEKINRAYGSIIPDIFIYDELNQATLEAILKFYERQEEINDPINPPSWMNTPEDRALLIIMDDCMASEKKILNSLTIKDLYKNGRHYKFALWVVVQYFNDLAPDLRANLDISLVLKVPNKVMQKKFFEFFGGFKDKDQFADVLNKYTQKYGCLVKDANSTDTSLDKLFFWYKADMTPDNFQMNPDQWAFHKYHYIDKSKRKTKRNWDEFSKNPVAGMNNEGSSPAAGRSSSCVSGGRRSGSGGKNKGPQYRVLFKYDENGIPIDD